MLARVVVCFHRNQTEKAYRRMAKEKKNARIEVFRVGTFTPMGGSPLAFAAADLKAIADAYDPLTSPAPMVVGHPKTDDPAYGWAESFSFDPETNILSADLAGIEPSFATAVQNGDYKKVSLEFFSPTSPSNPKPGTYYPKHIGFLGAVPPAVSGLKPVAFADYEDGEILTFEGTISFGTFDAENVGSIFRGIRDWLIEEKGKEKADEIIPSWRIDWVNDLELKTDDPDSFAAPLQKSKKDKSMSDKDTAAFAARDEKLKVREAAQDKREVEAAHADNVSFAEGLVTAEKLIPANQEKVVALLDAVIATDAPVSFAGTEEKVPVGQAIRDLLTSQPKVVSFGDFDMGDDPEAGNVASFATPEGARVDSGEMALHAKAINYQAAHPGTDFLTAVQAVGG